MEPAPILIVGVDIGVSTSGISCCLFVPGTTNPQPPKSIKLQGRENHLEPTELGIGEDSNTYGSGIATGEDRLTLLKLSVMDPNELRDLDHPVRHPRIQQALDKNKNHGSEIDALGEYIKRLWTDGSRLVKDDLLDFGDFRPEDVKTRFVLGVPAIWGQESINRMEEAIITSGILAFGGGEDAKLDFVLEPVAAAMATIPGVARDKRPKVGDKVLILDCGGGTVDTIAYDVTSSENPVMDDNFKNPQGRFLGSIFMKDNFVFFVKEEVKAQMGNGHISVNHTALDSNIEKLWKSVEQEPLQFWKEDTIDYLHVQCTDGILAVKLSRLELREALLPTAQKIARFAKEQVQAAGQVTRIVVVGGFGCNALVQAKLRGQFKGEVENDIEDILEDEVEDGVMDDVELVFTHEAGEVAVKDGACLTGIQLAEAEANPGPAGQHQGDDASAPPQDDAPASFGYRPDYKFQTIKWFISKDKPISKSKLRPTLFDFPPATAFKPGPDPSSSTMFIYRTKFKMNGLKYQAGDKKVSACRVVKCEKPHLLTNGSEWELGVYIGSKVEFGVFVEGQPCADEDFSVTQPQ